MFFAGIIILMSILFCSVFLWEEFRHFNTFGLSLFSVLALEEVPEVTSEMEFFEITVNGLPLMTVLVRSSVLDVAAFLDPTLNPFLYFRFNITKELNYGSKQI